MEEKIIIDGRPSKKTSAMLLKIGGVFVVVGLLLFIFTVNSSWRIMFAHADKTIGTYFECLGDCIVFTNGTAFVSLILDLGIISLICSLIWSLSIRKTCITVTNKRVYGVTKWNKRVDLPLNQISTVATSWLKGIAVGTSSGKIIFKAIENNIEVHKELTRLLAAKQDAPAVQTVKVENSNNIEDLKKIKDLLDSGIITQEEFDAKKKQILGL